MNTKQVKSRQFGIFCFSDMLGGYTPSLWPTKPTKAEAEAQARQVVRFGTKYEIRPVVVVENVPTDKPQTRPTVEQRLRALLIGERIPFEISDSQSGEIIAPKNQRLQRFHVKRIIAKRNRLDMPLSPLRNVILKTLNA